MKLALRPASAADLPFLLELRVQTMTQHQLRSGLVVSPRGFVVTEQGQHEYTMQLQQAPGAG